MRRMFCVVSLACVLLLAGGALVAPALAAPPDVPLRLIPYEPKPPTVLQRGLAGVSFVLRWLNRFAVLAPYVRDLLESVEELRRLLLDARRAADVEAQLERVLVKFGEFEKRFGASTPDQAEVARLRPLVKRLQLEIERTKRSRRAPCGTYMYRGSDGCLDRRDHDPAN